MSANFADGVYFVSLAPLADPELIMPTVAEAVCFQFYPGGTPKEQLLDFFREKTMLVILDNFEHLLAGASLVSDILQTAPNVKIIATSRERLNLQQEVLFRVESMDLPEMDTDDAAADCGSVRLFVQSARRAQPGLTLTADNVTDVLHICRQVEGMPLGILLAAAWADNLSLAEISEEIAHSFDFLEIETRDVPLRQRSIRAVFDHSWNMLTAGEQAMFSRLSVFRGGFTRESAQAVTGATLKTLAALVNKSFVRRNPDGRYEMHELLRQYAEAKLNEMPGALNAAQDQHCAYFAELMEQQAPRLKSAAEKEALGLIESEFDNVRTAWDFALAAEQFDVIGKSAEALALFCFIKAAHAAECEQFFQKGINRLRPCTTTAPLRVLFGQLLAIFAYYSSVNAHFEAARVAFSEADELLRVHATEYERAIGHLWWVRARASDIHTWAGLTVLEWRALRERQQQDLAIFELSDDTWHSAATLTILAMTQFNMNDLSATQLSARRSLSLFQTLGTRFWQFLPLRILGDIAFARNEYTTSVEHHRQATALSQEFGNDRETATSFIMLAWNYAMLGEHEEAKTYREMALALRERLGDRFAVALTLDNFGGVAREQGLYTDAYRYSQQALSIFRQLGRQEEAANQLNNTVAIVIDQGRYALAEQHCREVLSVVLSTEMHSYRMIPIESLLYLGLLTAKSGNWSLSASILTFALALLEDIYSADDIRSIAYDQLHTLGEKYLTEVHAELSPEAFAVAQEDAKSLELESLAAEILASPPMFPEGTTGRT